jgi:PTS system nitrogen regulatory IIA component
VQLTLSEAARLLQAPERAVLRWVDERKLPAQRVGDQYRFNRAELLEWAIANRVAVSPELAAAAEEAGAQAGVAEMLEAGGIFRGVAGSDRDAALRAVVRTLPLPEEVDPGFVFEMLRAREQLGSTALGDGVAIPHPRHPLVLNVANPSITLCFLATPIDYGAPDGQPVAALFTVLSPTVRAHLHALARLSFALLQPGFRGAVTRQAAAEEILAEARAADALARERGR